MSEENLGTLLAYLEDRRSSCSVDLGEQKFLTWANQVREMIENNNDALRWRALMRATERLSITKE